MTRKFTIQQQDPGAPIIILGPHPENKFIARMDEGTMEDARLLAAAPEMFQALVNCRTSCISSNPAPVGQTAADRLREINKIVESALARAKGN